MAKGLTVAADCTAAHGEIINLGNEETHTIRSVAEMVRSHMAVELSPRYGAKPARANEARVWATSNEKARNILGWMPATALSDGLEKTIASYFPQFTKTSSSATNQ